MGLDILAYQYVALLQSGAFDERLEGELHLSNHDFPSRSDGLGDGHYLTGGEHHHFRAGSYSGYNYWRDQLCHAAFGISAKELWASPVQGPFVELIHFTDCDGFIGPRTAAKLARDFAENHERVIARWSFDPEAPFLMDRYADFCKAFGIAAGRGVVVFT